VGCGIGEPAIYLHEKYHCSIIGITISEKGLGLGIKKNEEKGYAPMVQFRLADALDNGFPSNSFDFVWQMESSHLIRDKGELFLENFRVLKNSATMLLCDLILNRDLTVVEVYKYRKELNVLEKSFGKVKMITFENYSKELKKAGFSDIETIDISKQIFPTFGHWQNNITQNRKSILKYFNEDNVSNFLLSCEILKDFFKDNIFGYGLVKAKKAEKKNYE
jgi:ubiquinone/menaquinone biosynthesis C-methylase UbiE